MEVVSKFISADEGEAPRIIAIFSGSELVLVDMTARTKGTLVPTKREMF